MKAQKDDWYKHGWTLDIKNQSWVEDTENQVDFIIKTLRLTGKERILDLACGYGPAYPFPCTQRVSGCRGGYHT